MPNNYIVTHKYNLFNRLDRACLLLSSDASFDDIAEEAKCTVNDVKLYVEHRIAELTFRRQCQDLLERLKGYDQSITP